MSERCSKEFRSALHWLRFGAGAIYFPLSRFFQSSAHSLYNTRATSLSALYPLPKVNSNNNLTSFTRIPPRITTKLSKTDTSFAPNTRHSDFSKDFSPKSGKDRGANEVAKMITWYPPTRAAAKLTLTSLQTTPAAVKSVRAPVLLTPAVVYLTCARVQTTRAVAQMTCAAAQMSCAAAQMTCAVIQMSCVAAQMTCVVVQMSCAVVQMTCAVD